MSLKGLYNEFDYRLYLLFSGLTEEEETAMPDKVRLAHKKVYDILMYLFMFWCFTFAFAWMYEGMSFSALGYVPPNFAQITPFIVWAIMIGFVVWASQWFEKNKEKLEGDEKAKH